MARPFTEAAETARTQRNDDLMSPTPGSKPSTKKRTPAPTRGPSGPFKTKARDSKAMTGKRKSYQGA